MVEQLTLYSAKSKLCPLSHKVEPRTSELRIPEEAIIPQKKPYIDSTNIPEWYAPKVDLASEVHRRNRSPGREVAGKNMPGANDGL